jgi:hypothetical protein
VGTCVGHRNIRYFIAFLFWTAIHALVVFCISFTVFLKIKETEAEDTAFGAVTKGIIVFTGVIGIVLFIFCMY